MQDTGRSEVTDFDDYDVDGACEDCRTRVTVYATGPERVFSQSHPDAPPFYSPDGCPFCGESIAIEFQTFR
jgi:hypothetical protein